MYQLRETLFDKKDCFIIPYSHDQKLFKNMATFDFESICVQEDKFRDTATTNWIDKHFSIFVSISSNLIEQPVFFCIFNPGALVESFVGTLGGLPTESKTQMNLKFSEIETSVKSKLNQILSDLNQRLCCKKPVLEFEDDCIKKEEEEQDVSTQFCEHKRINLLVSRITWEPTRLKRRKVFFPYDWFGDPKKLDNTQLPPYETFF